jgi:hypothetical protein
MYSPILITLILSSPFSGFSPNADLRSGKSVVCLENFLILTPISKRDSKEENLVRG